MGTKMTFFFQCCALSVVHCKKYNFKTGHAIDKKFCNKKI